MKIFIVEDERIIAKDIENTLLKNNYIVSGIEASGEKAIEMIENSKPDLILMDIKLKGEMDGIETAEIIKDRFDIPVIYLTSYRDEKTFSRAKVTEPYGYIIKPFDHRELKMIIEIALYKHKIKRKIKRSRERFSTTLKSIGDAVIASNTRGRIQFMNKVAQELTGYSEKEARGKELNEIFKIYDNENKEIIFNPLNKIDAKNKQKKIQQRSLLLSKQGHKIPIEYSSSPIINEKKKINGLVLIFRDITEKEKSERKISEIQSRLNQSIRGSNIGLWSWDVDSDHLLISPEWKDHINYSGDDAISLERWEKIIHPEDREEIVEKFKELAGGQIQSLDIEYRMIHSDGNFRWFLNRASLMKDAAGNPIRVLGSHLDITERKKMEDELRNKNQMLSALIDSSPLAIISLDINGEIQMWNKAAEKMFGWSKEETVGKILPYINNPDNYKENLELLEKFLTGKSLTNQELIRKRKDGSIIIINISTAPLKDAKGNINGVVGIIADITYEKRTETSLRISEQKYRDLFNFSPMGIYQTDFDGNFLTINETLAKILKYNSADELQSQNLIKDIYLNPEEREKIINIIEDKGVIVNYSLVWKCKDKTTIWVQLTSHAVKNEYDKILYYEGFVNDITEYKEASKKIKEGEERFRQLSENIRDVFYVTDAEFSKMYYVSPAFEEIWGRSPESLYNSSEVWRNSVFIEDREYVFNAVSTAALNNGFDIEYRITRPNRRIRWVRDRVFPVKDNNKNIFRYTGIVEDVTDQKMAEEELRKLSHAIQQNPALIVITDPQGNIEYVNPKFFQVTGYSYEEIKGKNPRILKSGHTKPEEYKVLWKTISSGGEWRGEFYNKKKDGRYYWESALISPIKNRNDEITHYLAVKEDITERKKQEEQLIIAKEEAEKSDRLKSEFLAQMSHEIRTPLNNILTYASLLKEEMEGKLPSGLEQTFRVINSSALRLIRTIDLILNLSKIQTGNFETYYETIDLNYDILDELILEFYTRASDKNIKLKYTNNSKHSRIYGDSYTVSQIFVNLIDNAIKYTNGGEIEVVLYNKPDEEVCVDVTDTGIGISKEFIPVIFDPFSQEDSSTTRNYEGTGLGLALVKKYAELNSAKIEVESKKNKGTTFRISFKSSSR